MVKLIGFKDGDRVVLSVGGQSAGTPAWGAGIMTHELTGHVGRSVPIEGLPYVADLRILAQPSNGRLVRTRDGLALMKAGLGSVPIPVEVVDVSPAIATRQDQLQIEIADPKSFQNPFAPPPEYGLDYHGLPLWGYATGENCYRLPLDAEGNFIVEPGTNHRVVYVSGAGMSLADIAAHAGVSLGTVTKYWLAAHPEYGGTKAMAIDLETFRLLWSEIAWSQACSHWALFECGYTYDAHTEFAYGSDTVGWTRGESPSCPILIDAWGEGAPPLFVGSIKTAPMLAFGNCDGNVVVQNIRFRNEVGAGSIKFSGRGSMPRGNFILNKLHLEYGVGISISGTEFTLPQQIRGATIRSVVHRDVWLVKSLDKLTEADQARVATGEITMEEGEWHDRAETQGGFFSSIIGFDYSLSSTDALGWNPLSDNTATGLHNPPTQFAQGYYMQAGCADISYRKNLLGRAASFAVQVRPGGFVEDNVFYGSNAALNTVGNDYPQFMQATFTSKCLPSYRWAGQYAVLQGNVITMAGGKPPTTGGAMAWGTEHRGSGLVDVGGIIAHHQDPNNPFAHDTQPRATKGHRWCTYGGMADTAIWRWPDEDGVDGKNVDGLDPATLDGTTLQAYTGATGNALYQAMRDLVDQQGSEAVRQQLLNYFRAAFGRLVPVHPGTPQSLQFLPNVMMDGVRWDNRANWSDGFLPGDGDTVDLGWCEVVFNTEEWSGIVTGPRSLLRVCGSQMTVTGGELGDISVENAGKLVIEPAATVAGDLKLADNGRITGGAFDLTGRTLTLAPRTWHGSPEMRDGTVDLGGCAVTVDLTNWIETSVVIPIAGLSGALGAVTPVGLAADQDLTVTLGADQITLTVATGTGQVNVA